MRARRPKINRYVPHGQPYVPGERRSIIATPGSTPPPPEPQSVVAYETERQEDFQTPPPPAASTADIDMATADAPARNEPAPITQAITLIPAPAPAPKLPAVVLFGGDPKARLDETPPPPSPPDFSTEEGWRTAHKAAAARVSALHASRWWIVLPICAALIAIGIVRLHKGPASIRTKDGVTIDIVSDDLSSIAPLSLLSEPHRQVSAGAPRSVLLAGLPADASGVRIPAPPTLDAERPAASTAAAQIPHVGAIPRTGLCTFVNDPPSPPTSVMKLSGTGFGAALADAAEAQVRDFVVYDDEYRTIKYPGGDVPRLYGVCSDVVIRAYRALGIDLQVRVHQARVGSPDRSIAHRRTENLRRYFKRVGASLPVTDFAEDYLPGDIVTYDRPQNRGSQDHIAIVSNIRGPSGRPMIVHNRGFGPQIEDALFVDTITGHYRYRGASPANDKTSAASPDKNATGKTQKRAESDPPAPGSAPVSPPPKL